MQDNTTDKELVLQAMREYGRSKAAQLQEASAEMTGTELYAEEDYIPDFAAACAQKNMLERAAGFVCRSTAGRVVKLLQPYDSTIYTGEPETLPAQWGFVWSTDPAKALPFVAMSTSPYMTGDCCTDGGKVWRSTIDNNVWAPTAHPRALGGQGPRPAQARGGRTGGGRGRPPPHQQQGGGPSRLPPGLGRGDGHGRPRPRPRAGT